MKITIRYIKLALLSILPRLLFSQNSVIDVKDFDKIIISPHISANLVESDQPSVELISSEVPLDKINVKVEGKTLRIFLDGAKTITRSKRIDSHNRHLKRPIYQGTIANVTIYYKTLHTLSVRGEEEIICASPLSQDELHLRIYGEPDVVIKNLMLDYFEVTMYGEADLSVEGGEVNYQKYVSYGENNVKIRNIKNNSTQIRAFGESDFDLNVSDHLKVTALGEAKITYQGAPKVQKGIVLGEARIRKSEMSL